MSSTSRAALLCALLVPASAFATARSVTLLGVSGAGGERFAGSLENDLSELYDVVSGDVYRSMAEHMGKRGASPEEVSAVSTKLRIDAVVGGAVVGEGRHRRLLIAVREGATGGVIARGRYDLSTRTLPLIRERVVSDLVRALERVRPIGKAGSVPPTQQPVSESDDVPSSEPADVEPIAGTAAAVTEKASARPATQAAGVSAGVGPSLLSRTLSFDVPSAPAYRGGTVAGLRVEGVIFPLALSNELAQAHPALASFGVMATFENVFNFHSSTTVGSSVGKASRWSALFVGRIPLGHAAVGGTLTLETGWQTLNYTHDAPIEVGVPNVSLGAIDAGLGWDRALGARWLVLDLRIAYLGLVQAGEITDGANYGPGNGNGVAISGALSLLPVRWLWIRLRGSYDHMGLKFAGAGTRFARSANDDWVGGQLEVGFAL